MKKKLSVATRIDSKAMQELKKIYPDQNPSTILRLLVDERIAIKKNTENLLQARKSLAGKKSDRSLI